MNWVNLKLKSLTLLDYFKRYKLVKFVFLMTFIASLVVIFIAHYLSFQNQKIHAQYVVADYANLLEKNIAQSLSATYPMASLIKNQQGNTLGFEKLADEMLTFYPAASSLQLAPNGIVQHIVPLKGNEKAIGHNLLFDPTRNKEAFLAKETKQLTLAGPFTLKQGGVGVIGRLPIYLLDQDQKEVFWGFSSVLLDFPKLLTIAQLAKLEERGFAYVLSRIHPDTKEIDVLANSKAPLLMHPIIQLIEVPNSTWTLSAIPIDGWFSYNRIFLELLLAFVFAFFITLLTIFFKNLDHQNILKEQALYDSLTHLPNRSFFKELFLSHLKTNTLSALCFLDLDHFKHINDTYGHHIGDVLLLEVTHRIQKCLREKDTLSRHGGDEFVIILSSLLSKEDTLHIVQRILNTISDPYEIAGFQLFISASIGIVFYDTADNNLEELISKADQSMYKAKMSGRNGYAIYEGTSLH